MPDLIAKTPLDGIAPLTRGGVTLSERAPGRITSVAPLAGQDKALARALKAMGLGWPGPGGLHRAGATRIVWSGRGQAFLFEADPAPLAAHAALTDQSDGWAGLAVEGAGATAVLARLCPLDPRAFAPGTAARAPLNHMAALWIRAAPEAYEVFVFRSMARTAWHEIGAAMTGLAARDGAAPKV